MNAVVGYDGSDAAKGALGYAARTVGADGRLVVLYAHDPHSLEPMRDPAAVLTGLPAEALGAVAWETRLCLGDPVRALTEVAEDCRADAIVVATREFGLVRSQLGRVCRGLLEEARVPVTVVPSGYEPSPHA